VIVVADTSVLINLCRVGQDGLLRQLFQEIVIPPEVAGEFVRLVANISRFTDLELPSGIRQQPPSIVAPAVRDAVGLDLGEAAALSLAVEIRADAVLIDERRGHEVAVQLGLRTIGILGILLRAKSAGFLFLVRPVLDALQQDAGFWLSESIRKQVLTAAGEKL
jgi:predicted nucleic acid-binding protein